MLSSFTMKYDLLVSFIMRNMTNFNGIHIPTSTEASTIVFESNGCDLNDRITFLSTIFQCFTFPTSGALTLKRFVAPDSNRFRLLSMDSFNCCLSTLPCSPNMPRQTFASNHRICSRTIITRVKITSSCSALFRCFHCHFIIDIIARFRGI